MESPKCPHFESIYTSKWPIENNTFSAFVLFTLVIDKPNTFIKYLAVIFANQICNDQTITNTILNNIRKGYINKKFTILCNLS